MSTPSQLRAPKGVAEYVAASSANFATVRDTLLTTATEAGYLPIQLPMFEDTALFVRGVGESTDVVSKEMFTFTDRGGRSLTLRPEGTAGAIRAIIEHQLDKGQLPVKISYAGEFFRAERPQAGRYRQFNQVGVEAVGSSAPALDAEVIATADAGFRKLGLRQYQLLLNSLGCAQCRMVYRAALVAYLSDFELDEATTERMRLNPLRVLDDKRPELASMIAGAPVPVDYLCDDCRRHYDQVRCFLQGLSVSWVEAPRLVRGLDYYTRTTFEFSHQLLGAQSGIGGGGRYDGLMASLGGSDHTGIGFGLGVDRSLLACQAEELHLPARVAVDVYGIALGDGTKAVLMPLLAQLRAAGVVTDMLFDDKSMRAAMKFANRSGAKFTLILAERELAEGVITVRNMDTGDQHTLTLAQAPASIIAMVSASTATATHSNN